MTAYVGRATVDAVTGRAVPASRMQLDALKALQDATEMAHGLPNFSNRMVRNLANSSM